MNTTELILAELRQMRNEFAQLKSLMSRSEKREAWVTGSYVSSQFGLDANELKKLRKQNVIVFKTEGPRRFKYQLSSITNYITSKSQS